MTSKSTSAGIRLEALINSLIRYAARTAPASLSERLEEEWLADLAARSTVLSRLRFALGCCWATRVIAHDYLGSRAVIASSASGQAVAGLRLPEYSPFSRRGAISLLIIAAHAALIYGFATIFVHATAKAPGLMRGVVYDSPTPVQHEPPPKIHLPNSFGRAKEPTLAKLGPLEIRFPTDEPERELANPLTVEGQQGQPQIPFHRARVIGGPGPGFPRTDDYYPASARRLGEMGLATVRVCVDDKGRISADPAIVQSSGSIRLDEGALRLAKAGSGHYKATTQDGAPVNDCYPLRIRFKFAE